MTTTLSRRQVLALAASVPVALTLGSPAHAVPVQAGACSFVPVAPSRLAETRASEGQFGFTRIDSRTIRVQIAGRNAVPANAAAVVLNVTATNAVAAGYVSVYPTGTALPEASNLNIDRAGQIVANLVTVLLGTDGSVDIYSSQPNDVVVDIGGAYIPQSSAVSSGRFVALATAFRALDTRERGVGVGSGQTESVSVASVVPTNAIAVVVNLTVTESNGPGFFTAFAAGASRPDSSNLNADAAGQTRANQTIVPVGTGGTVFGINVFASSGGHLIVDIAGYFTGPTAAVAVEGLFVPGAPYRALDTRTAGSYGRLQGGWTAEFDYSGRAASQAVVVNLTTTQTRGAGYFTGYPARTNRPVASNLNAVGAAQTVANHAILRTSTSGVAVFTQRGGHLVVDVAGYFIGSPSATVSLSAAENPAPGASQLPYALHLPSIGANGYVAEGVSHSVVDKGLVGHWPEVGLAGENSHMVLFGHRTKFGSIFKNLHLLGPGAELIIESPSDDGRVYHYEFARRDITGESNAEIFGVGLFAPLPNVSLVACSKTNFLPTDTRHRIVVTFSLVRVDPG
jgi:sortase (surface protein transpeptidase)